MESSGDQWMKAPMGDHMTKKQTLNKQQLDKLIDILAGAGEDDLVHTLREHTNARKRGVSISRLTRLWLGS